MPLTKVALIGLAFEFRVRAAWSYGDSNPGPLACHPAAGRPPPSICAGHRPRTSPRVPRNPGRLLYFPAVPLCRRGWSWPPQPAGTRPVRACKNSAGRASRDPGTRPEPKATKSQAPARPAAPTTLASARPACLRRSRNAWKCCPGRNHTRFRFVMRAAYAASTMRYAGHMQVSSLLHRARGVGGQGALRDRVAR